MFKGQSAWFSTSVSKNVRRLWVDNEGRISELDDAQFIFSKDTESPDTIRIFDSEAYLEEHLAVFHPNYIKECVKQGATDQVVLGKYFFPPGDVQAIARDQLQYQWDVDGHTSDGHSVNSSDEENPAPLSNVLNQSKNVRKNSVDAQQASTSKPRFQKEPGGTSKKHDKDKDHSGVDAAPMNRQSSDKVQTDSNKQCERRVLRRSSRQHNQNAETVSDNDKNYDSDRVIHELRHRTVKSAEKTTKTGSTSREVVDKNNAKFSDSACGGNKEILAGGSGVKGIERNNNHYQHLDICDSEILRLEDLAKVTGDLQDFVVGKNGCDLVKIC